MLRTSRTSSDPMLTVATTEPAPLADRGLRLAVVGLGTAGLVPPLAFIVVPGDLGHIAGVPIAVALTALLILAPALAGLATASFGLDRLRESCHSRGDREHAEAAFRICVGALAVFYGLALTIAAPSAETSAALIVASLGLAGAWVLLLLAILDPLPSPPRHYLALVFDAAFVSAFLHFGGDLTAPWVLTYLLTTFHAGFRGGIVSLAVSAILNLAGFAAVIATTAYWWDQSLLAGGLVAALVALPAYIGGKVHEVAASREEAAAAQAARTRFLMVISQALRAPLDAMIGAPKSETPTAVPAARALLSQVSNVLDFTAIEAGAFVPATEAFDLHRLVNDTLADRRTEAAAKGVRLRTHIDPALPHRLRGWPQQLAQIFDYLVSRAIEVTAEGAVRVSLDSSGMDDRRVRLRLVVRDGGAAIAPLETRALFDPFVGPSGAVPADGPSGHGAFGLAVVRRLVELMGGEIDVGRAEAGGSFTIRVPLAIDELAVDSELDLEGCLVLIATEDSQFASDLAEPLNAWNGEPQWIDSFDKTLDFAERGAARACSVLIVDGRRRKLAALSFAHRAAISATPPSFVLFIADAAQIGGLMELAEDELDAVLPAPLDNRLFAIALHALPLWHGVPARPVVVPPAREADATADPPPLFDPAPEPTAPEPVTQVTPIATHPRFAAEAPIVDPRAVAALRGLGGGDEFLGEVLDSFRTEAEQIMQRLVRAAASADSAGFARGLHALRSCAANLGGTRLCEVLLSLREVGGQELREQGSALVQRLGDELGRLDAALAEFLPATGERREA
jgi:signal transduction histidine kinase/HPt (histidine-containing phosphotransfer) domain-containing protein